MWMNVVARLSAIVACLSGALPVVAQVDFQSQVIPLLTRSGCNAGACHGSATGRGDFTLSLLGSRPADDYAQIVQAFEGRRLNLIRPDQSLLLRKPAGELDHGGDTVLPPESPGYQLLERWVIEGAARGPMTSLSELHVDVNPVQVQHPDDELELTVWATFDGPARQNVTSLTRFTVDDAESVQLVSMDDANTPEHDTQRVRILRSGQHVILARYMSRVVPIQVRLPHSSPQLGTQDDNFPHDAPDSVIDQHVGQLLSQMHLRPAAPIDDLAFLRRVSLDLTGKLPDLPEIEHFARDQRLDKRARLVDRLLASVAFVDYWSLRYSRWLNLHGVPNETQAVDSFARWIRDSIAGGIPWSDMTKQLLTATGDANEVGPANFARMVPDARQHAELVSRVFMGVRMDCANCHDHPLDKWTQDDYHGLAAIFARLDRGRFVHELPRGEVTNPRTGQAALRRLPGTGNLKPDQPALLALTHWLNDSPAQLLARSFVNRHWQAMLGRGLVEAVDDLRDTNPASHPELLSELAQSVVDHEYDLRHFLRSIACSQTYARTAGPDADAMLASSHIKPLLPEVWLDAIADVTGVMPDWEQLPHGARAVHVVDPLMVAPQLDVLGRCRHTADCVGGAMSEPGLATQLHLINGALINAALEHPQGRLRRLQDQGVPTREIIDQFVTLAWSRPPSASQLDLWCQEVSTPEALEDFLWALLASPRFQRN